MPWTPRSGASTGSPAASGPVNGSGSVELPDRALGARGPLRGGAETRGRAPARSAGSRRACARSPRAAPRAPPAPPRGRAAPRRAARSPLRCGRRASPQRSRLELPLALARRPRRLAPRRPARDSADCTLVDRGALGRLRLGEQLLDPEPLGRDRARARTRRRRRRGRAARRSGARARCPAGRARSGRAARACRGRSPSPAFATPSVALAHSFSSG